LRITAGRSLFAALAAALLIPVQVKANVPVGAVAVVGEQPVTRVAFDHWFRIAAISLARQRDPHPHVVLPKPPRFTACVRALPHSVPVARRRSQCRVDYRTLRDQTLQHLITIDWVEGEAALQGIAVTAAEVDAEFARARRQSFPRPKDFRRFLRQSGMTIVDLKLRVRAQLLSERLRDKISAGATPVTDEDVAAYYAAHRSRFRVPERRDVRIVLTRFAWQARRALALLRAGVPWRRVTRTLSIDEATRHRGGRLTVARGQQERPLERAIFRARLHRLRGPIRTQFGFYVFAVSRARVARQLSLADVAPTIHGLLESQRRQTTLDSFVKDFQQRWKSVTACRRGFVVADCGAVEGR
jgi:foldase protein PrsA